MQSDFYHMNLYGTCIVEFALIWIFVFELLSTFIQLIYIILLQGKAKLHEFVDVHGTNSSGDTASCNVIDGEKCDSHDHISCKKRYNRCVLPAFQLFSCLFCQLDQFFGH